GMAEVPKPAALAGRGGVWFRSFDAAGGVSAELHVGVEDPFVPARKAHPAFFVGSVETLDQVAQRLVELGFEVDQSQRLNFPGYQRIHAFDGHGNRVELLSD
ncbi:VOC family protein, partial [Nocardioides sp.]|uniref:VOC family protein n=1 Tax=Nocardioides sp. TaxID=35761 RepID=UPI003567C496